MLERYLALTRRRIVELGNHIERQRRIVADFEAGRSTEEGLQIARDLLQTLELNLQCQIRHERRLTMQLCAQADSGRVSR